MNVLFLVHYPELYGSIRSLLDLVSGLKEFGIVPHFILPANGGLSDFLDQQASKYTILKTECWVSENSLSIKEKFRKFQELSCNTDQISDYLKQWSIDLMYTNTIVSPTGLIAARRNHLPHIWHIREFGDLDFGLRFIYPKALSKTFMLLSDAVICHSKVVRNYHFKPGEKNIHQIYNGSATLDQFAQRLERRLAEPVHEVYTFAMFSSLTPKKGQVDAIKALAGLRERGLQARLVLAGSGKPDYVDTLNQLAADLTLSDQVQFTGFVEDPFPLYYAADCALICSEYEALSRVGLEAMSTALPLIGRNSGGTPEIIADGQTGLLYNSPGELLKGMCRMVQEPAWACQLGLAGWQRAKELFNIEDYAAGVYQVIQKVMEKR